MFKHLRKGYQTSRRMSQSTSKEKVSLEREAQKIEARQREEKCRLQLFKLSEVIGESVPQSILQVFIVLKSAECMELYFRRLFDVFCHFVQSIEHGHNSRLNALGIRLCHTRLRSTSQSIS